MVMLRRIAFICFIFFICLCSTAWAPTGSAQNATPLPLGLAHTYIVTGDYVVGGVGLRGLGDASGFATGTISIPDCVQAIALNLTPCPPPPVPAGAEIVAAFLYWETVESNQASLQGRNGFFNGYKITGDVLGNPNAPTSWSSGGCSGSSQGSKTIRGYRADVRPYLPVDLNANIQPNATYTVRLADSGSNGGGVPLTLGASLVIVYRVLSPKMPLNAIVLYDGAFAPNNSTSVLTQPIIGFYDAAKQGARAKITHIVGDGQANKSESVTLNGSNLPFLYPAYPNVAFPGIYNGSWDNPTWSVGDAIVADSSSVTTKVTPSGSGSGCVDWGAIVFSTTVQSSDNDGLLDSWKTSQGYCDAAANPGTMNQGQCLLGNADPSWVLLPGATPGQKDLFVEVDYLNNLNPYATPPSIPHSHLPKQEALDMVGKAFAAQNIHVHFDVGSVYQSPMVGGPSTNCGKATCDPYIISNPAGIGGNSISESDVLCNDGATLCQFPGQPAVAWKGGLLFLRDTAPNPNATPPVPLLGNFQQGRALSYHYVLFGHSLGDEESFWSTLGSSPVFADPLIPQLVSIVNNGTAATVTIQSPAGTVKPGDCPNAAIPACSDANAGRVTVGGALGQPSLNGTYTFSNFSNSGGVTTFNITTSNVASGTYQFACGPADASDNPPCAGEPQLALSYLGPTSTSGHSDFRGGGDSAVTFGLWGADDPANCQRDPAQPLSGGQSYCDNQVGSVLKQAGTMMHELGHSLTLTHGGAYYTDPANPSVPTYEANCKSNFLSVMSYQFQVRGFPDNLKIVDYSGQTFMPIDETKLNEVTGIGNDSNNFAAAHYTRWFGPPNSLDTLVGRVALSHCDGSPIGLNEQPAVRVDGSTLSGPLDWNNDLTIAPSTTTYQQDANFDGFISSANALPGLHSFNDWQAIDLLQIGARAGAAGFSGGGGVKSQSGGGGVRSLSSGGGVKSLSGGGGVKSQSGGGGVKSLSGGGGADQDENDANSTSDAPIGLTCTIAQGLVPGCTASTGSSFLEKSKSVPLTWHPPTFGQTREYNVWRATGSFPTPASANANSQLFTKIQTIPINSLVTSPTYTDGNVRSNTTYTYFITDKNKLNAVSGASAPIVVTVKF